MSSDKQIGIVPGQKYLLDTKVIVTVLKAVNRAKTSFSIEIPNRGIEIVDSSRLKEIVVN